MKLSSRVFTWLAQGSEFNPFKYNPLQNNINSNNFPRELLAWNEMGFVAIVLNHILNTKGASSRAVCNCFH